MTLAAERLSIKKTENSFESTFLEHIARYRFAQKFIKGKTVLDAACGTGYGSYYLSQRAKKVIGIDISPEAIAFCRKEYHRNNLSFQVGDIETTSFSDNFFDLVVSFETIEHLKHPDKFVSEMHRVLKKNGRFLISTPVKDVYDRTFLGNNPYHLHELTVDEFKLLLSSTFSIQGMYGQLFLDYMTASADKLSAQNIYKKTTAFKIKQFLRAYVFNHSLTFPLFLIFSAKSKDNRLVPYSNEHSFKLITAVAQKTEDNLQS